MRSAHHIQLAVLLLVVQLQTCGGSPTITYYTLAQDKKAAASSPVKGLCLTSVGVGRVDLPDLLRRRGIVARTDDFTVAISQTHEWGGDLNDQLRRALVLELRRRLAGVEVMGGPWELSQSPDIKITLTVERFDGTPDQEAVMLGRWSLLRPRDGVNLGEGTISSRRPVSGRDMHSLVRAQSLLVGDLATRITAALGSTCPEKRAEGKQRKERIR